MPTYLQLSFVQPPEISNDQYTLIYATLRNTRTSKKKILFVLKYNITCKFIFESTTAGHFPPSSRITGVRCFAAADMTMRPTLALPA